MITKSRGEDCSLQFCSWSWLKSWVLFLMIQYWVKSLISLMEGLENQLQLQLNSNAFHCWGKGVFVKHILLIAALILRYMYVVSYKRSGKSSWSFVAHWASRVVDLFSLWHHKLLCIQVSKDCSTVRFVEERGIFLGGKLIHKKITFKGEFYSCKTT